MRLTDTKKIQDADASAIHVRGIPSTLLMRNAAGHLARAAERRARERSAVIFCGSGNNGGDGVAAAQFLLRWGFRVRVLLVGKREKMTEDTREMERRLIALGGRLEDFDPEEPGLLCKLEQAGVIVDALFGVGLRRELTGNFRRAVELINAAGAPVVAADIASGVEANTGRILGAAVRCTETVTFTAAKPGHILEPGCVCCGELTVADIGIPPELRAEALTSCRAIGRGELRLPRRSPLSHKGDYGKLLLLAGGVGYTGAPNLSAWAAIRAGAGLVSLGVPEPIYPSCAMRQTEAMVFPLAANAQGCFSAAAIPEILRRAETSDVLVCGPGIGRSGDTVQLVRALLQTGEAPLVLDADALWAVAQDPEMLRETKRPLILTPHDGEYARLGGTDTGGRMAGSLDFAGKYGVILVRKGHRSFAAFPDGSVDIIRAGNPGMAKGGSGDALAGILGAMLCQLPLRQAVPTALWLHGRAGDLARDELGEYAMTATDLIGHLAAAEQEMLEEE